MAYITRNRGAVRRCGRPAPEEAAIAERKEVRMSKKAVAGLLIVAFVVSFCGVAAYALDIGDAVKFFGIAFAVRHFSGQLNSFINTLLAQKGVQWEGATKVVPIVSLGRGVYIGAAQVAGSPELVKQIKAVGQGETSIGDLRGKLYVPLASNKPQKKIERVKGVGVTAIIDFKV